MKICQNCQATMQDGMKFCPECGTRQPTEVINCPACGAPNTGTRFCPECGYRYGTPATPAAIPPASYAPQVSFTPPLFNDADPFDPNFLSGIEQDSIRAQADERRENDANREIEQVFAAFEYEAHTDGTYTVTGLKDRTALQYTVPQGVVAIADNVFFGANAMRITLPEGLLQIGNRAFKGCRNLSHINLPDGLMIVGDEAFAECEMLDITLPATVKRVGKDAIKDTVKDKKAQEKANAKAEAKRKKEEREAEMALWVEGTTRTFGSYEQGNGKQPIEWLVLKRMDSRALLVSKFILDCKPFAGEDIRFTSEWYMASIRGWLNWTFLNEAFTDTEQQKITKSFVYTPSRTSRYRSIDTTDKIFLLSEEQAEEYFASNAARKCTPTAYARANGAKTGTWWLRSPDTGIFYIKCVSPNGSINGCKSNDIVGVRPALWIDLEA